MQRDDESSPTPGPLDQLFPGLRSKADRVERLPVHPRVVSCRNVDGSRSIVFASFKSPQNERAFHAALKGIVEAALLNELCRPAEEIDADSGALRSLELFFFEAPQVDVTRALSALGFTQSDAEASEARAALSLLRGEMRTLTEGVADSPVARYSVHVAASSHPLQRALSDALITSAPRGPWGREPGHLAKLAADWLGAHGIEGVEPTRAGIERIETIVVHHSPFVLRWVEPLAFQALCDLVAVMAVQNPELQVEWGICERDEETEAYPPPVLRVTRQGDTFHVPLGEHILRWSVMPVMPGEQVPTLGAWAEHEFQ